MAAPIVNFTSEYSTTDSTKLILTDTSEYNDTVIVNRQWVITKSNGVVTKIDAPIIGSSAVVITLDKDYSIIVKLRLNYNPAVDDSGFTKSRNILAANILSSKIYDLRKNFVVAFHAKDRTDKELMDLLEDIELADSFYEAAVNLVSTDIIAAQDALDLGNNQATLCNC